MSALQLNRQCIDVCFFVKVQSIVYMCSFFVYFHCHCYFKPRVLSSLPHFFYFHFPIFFSSTTPVQSISFFCEFFLSYSGLEHFLLYCRRFAFFSAAVILFSWILPLLFGVWAGQR